MNPEKIGIMSEPGMDAINFFKKRHIILGGLYVVDTSISSGLFDIMFTNFFRNNRMEPPQVIHCETHVEKMARILEEQVFPKLKKNKKASFWIIERESEKLLGAAKALLRGGIVNKEVLKLIIIINPGLKKEYPPQMDEETGIIYAPLQQP